MEVTKDAKQQEFDEEEKRKGKAKAAVDEIVVAREVISEEQNKLKSELKLLEMHKDDEQAELDSLASEVRELKAKQLRREVDKDNRRNERMEAKRLRKLDKIEKMN